MHAGKLKRKEDWSKNSLTIDSLSQASCITLLFWTLNSIYLIKFQELKWDWINPINCSVSVGKNAWAGRGLVIHSALVGNAENFWKPMWPRVKLETPKLRKKRNEKNSVMQKASNYPLFMSEMTSNIILFEFWIF